MAGGEETKSTHLWRTYLCLALYVVLSSAQIFFNKWILSSPVFNFPFPVTLTLLHMVFSSVLCFILFRVLKVLQLQPGMTQKLYIESVMPIGATFALTLWLGNTAYLYISVSFSQMLKAVMPVVVFLLSAAVGLEVLSWRMFGIMGIISCGVAVASYGEVHFNWLGVTYQMGGVFAEAARLILAEVLLKRKGVKLDPLSMMYYVSPCSAAFLCVPWVLLEVQQLTKSTIGSEAFEHLHPLIMILNALCTFALNLSVFLVIMYSSALTARVAGVVKDWLVVILSAVIFADAQLTTINLWGYGVALAGVMMYNSFKLQTPARVADQKLETDAEPLIRLTEIRSSSPREDFQGEGHEGGGGGAAGNTPRGGGGGGGGGGLNSLRNRDSTQ
eukprot:TRINITY_DN5523_c0_g2_i1.p1 TRINITY_DN5523_c0_g2~~TRINITY_DN5523_c0_g2_i1.p1  ORF type:complete len:387 (+),score=69.59 TRINITY_DN5523_c0_g2_i1:425-1585(+)